MSQKLQAHARDLGNDIPDANYPFVNIHALAKSQRFMGIWDETVAFIENEIANGAVDSDVITQAVSTMLAASLPEKYASMAPLFVNMARRLIVSLVQSKKPVAPKSESVSA